MSEKKTVETISRADALVNAVAELDEQRERVKEVSGNLELLALAFHTMTHEDRESDALMINVRALDRIVEKLGELCGVFEGGALNE